MGNACNDGGYGRGEDDLEHRLKVRIEVGGSGCRLSKKGRVMKGTDQVHLGEGWQSQMMQKGQRNPPLSIPKEQNNRDGHRFESSSTAMKVQRWREWVISPSTSVWSVGRSGSGQGMGGSRVNWAARALRRVAPARADYSSASILSIVIAIRYDIRGYSK